MTLQDMSQAKDKEQAVFHLYRVYDLEPVIFENLRPEEPSGVSPKKKGDKNVIARD